MSETTKITPTPTIQKIANNGDVYRYQNTGSPFTIFFCLSSTFPDENTGWHELGYLDTALSSVFGLNDLYTYGPIGSEAAITIGT